MSDQKGITGTVSARDGLSIFYQKHLAENEKARIVLVHGLGEYADRHHHLWDRLIPKGYSFFAPDHRGHGRSGGVRGHVMHFDQYLMDLQLIVDMARKDLAPGEKVFLFGHSMGGLIAMVYALRFPEMIDGVIVSSPALGMIVEVPKVKEILGKVMSSIWPSLTLDNELDPQKVSHDQQVVDDYVNDKMVHHKVSARWFTEFTGAMDWAQESASTLKVPALMLIAGDDYLVNAQSSKEFFNKLTLEDKELKFYDGLYHELSNEVEADREKVIDDLEKWLEAHA